MRRFSGFAPILIVVLVGILLLFGIIYYIFFDATSHNEGGLIQIGKKVESNNQSLKNNYAYQAVSRYDLPECGDNVLLYSIVDIEEIESVTPLGNMAPPDHTLPTEHLYFRLTDTGKLVDELDVYAPGDLYVTSVASSDIDLPGIGKQTEYSLFVSFCKDVHGYFGHLDGVDKKIEKLIDAKNCDNPTYCETWLNEPVKYSAGEVIAKVGKPRSQSFDFGTYDFGVLNEFANPSRYDSRSPFITCPFDFYSGGTKDQLYSKFEGVNGTCGQINFDVPDTLQGNWFYGDRGATYDWNNHLTFSYSNFDSSIAVISIGGVFTDASVISFTPKDTGFVNRKFDQIKADGKVYCFVSDGSARHSKETSGKVLVQMTSDTEIEIQKKSGECGSAESLTKPIVYKR